MSQTFMISRTASFWLMAAITAMLLVTIHWQDGAPWRIPAERIHASPLAMREQESAYCAGTDILEGVTLGGRPGEPLVTCASDIGAEHDIYVWGDSHARHLIAGLRQSFSEHNIKILYYTSCAAQNGIAGFSYSISGKTALSQGCETRNQNALAMLKTVQPTLVILHHYFGYENEFTSGWTKATQTLIDSLEASGHSVRYLGGVPRPGKSIVECLNVPATIPNNQLTKRCRGNTNLQNSIRDRNQTLAKQFGDHFIDLSDFFCTGYSDCAAFKNDTLLFRDQHHLTIRASEQIIAKYRSRLNP